MEKRVHADLKDKFGAVARSHNHCEANLAEKRDEVIRHFQDDAAAGRFAGRVEIREQYLPGPQGEPDTRVKLYLPLCAEKPLPGLLYIHGGGYIVGNADMMDADCLDLAADLPCAVVSVDYRLAPESPYPGPLEECYTALCWFAEQAASLGVDPDRIAVMGASAGGGLTAALALLARDRKGPAIAFQMPLCPMIDDRCETPSSNEVTDLRSWNADTNRFGWRMYLRGWQGETPPYAAPARAADLRGLPPAYTCVGDLDPFRDETMEYVSRLSKAGVPTEFHLYPGCFHGFENAIPDADVSKRYLAECTDALRRALCRADG